MSAAPRFSLRAAVTDRVSTGRREEPVPDLPEDRPTPATEAATPKTQPQPAARAKRSASREGARGITVWVEPEVYRMVKLAALDADMTTQDVMMEAIDDLLAKKGKGRITKTR